MAEVRRSALFVDFDNIYLGLLDTDAAAARAFAESPDRWVEALTAGEEDASQFRRRWLVRVCYLNPVRFGAFRPFFTRSGFRVVDCPPLTSRQKNSADIHMVLDILDALQHPAGYDEFVIASADADFTPVMMRLRAHGRRTAIVTAGPAAAAYRAVCDSVTTPEQLADALRPRAIPTSVGSSVAGSGAGLAPAGTNPPAVVPSQDDGVDPRVIEAIRVAVRTSERPIVGARAAQVALSVDPDLSLRGWAGAGKFTDFMAKHVPDLTYVPNPPPGYVFDPARHSASDLPQRDDVGPSEESVVRRVSMVTSVPPLTGQQYQVLFGELASELAESGYSRNTVKQARDQAHLQEVPIGRASVQFVVQGLLYAGVRLEPGLSAQELAVAWRDNVLLLCANAQMLLTPEEQSELSVLIVGGATGD